MPENEKSKKLPGRSITVEINNRIALDPLDPIPIQYNGDSFSIVNNKQYIPFLNAQDNFPNLLLEARLTSTTQNACVTSIAATTIGNGIIVLNDGANSKKIFHLCYGYTGDDDAANDLLQETFLKVWQNLDKFRNQAMISTWIYSHCSKYLPNLSPFRKTTG